MDRKFYAHSLNQQAARRMAGEKKNTIAPTDCNGLLRDIKQLIRAAKQRGLKVRGGQRKITFSPHARKAK